jgi:hypothetical protein
MYTVQRSDVTGAPTPMARSAKASIGTLSFCACSSMKDPVPAAHT